MDIIWMAALILATTMTQACGKIYDLELTTCNKASAGTTAYIDIKIIGTIRDRTGTIRTCEKYKINKLSLSSNSIYPYSIYCEDIGLIKSIQLQIDRNQQPCFERVRILDPVDKRRCYFQRDFKDGYWITEDDVWTEEITQGWETWENGKYEKNVKYSGIIGDSRKTHSAESCQKLCVSTADAKAWRWNQVDSQRCECITRLESRIHPTDTVYHSGVISTCSSQQFPSFWNTVNPTCNTGWLDLRKTHKNGSECGMNCGEGIDGIAGLVICRSLDVWRDGHRWDVVVAPQCGVPTAVITACVLSGITLIAGIIAAAVYYRKRRRTNKRQKGSPIKTSSKSILKRRQSYADALKEYVDYFPEMEKSKTVRFPIKYEVEGTSDSDSLDSTIEKKPNKRLIKRQNTSILTQLGSQASNGKDAFKFSGTTKMPEDGGVSARSDRKKRKYEDPVGDSTTQTTIFITPEALQPRPTHQPSSGKGRNIFAVRADRSFFRSLSMEEQPTSFVFTSDPPKPGLKASDKETKVTAPVKREQKQTTYQQPDIFEINQRTFGQPHAAFEKSEAAFAKGQQPFKVGPNAFAKGQKAFNVGPSAFNQNQDLFRSGQDTFKERREVFQKSRDTFANGQARFDRGKEAFAQGQTRFRYDYTC